MAMALTINFVSAQDYMGAEFCQACHPDEYAGWSQTRHANAAGMNPDGTFWVSDPNDPSRNEGDLDAWKNSCANCHVLNWNADDKTFAFSETDPAKGLGIQCEECHGPGMTMTIDRSLDLCGKCHTSSHSQVADFEKGGHSMSYETLQTSDHATDDCLHCMTTEGFLGDTVTLDSDLTSLTCVVCHNPHEGTNDKLLRTATVDELCAECHNGTHHPQSEEAMYPSGPHAKAGVECTDCHGAGEHLAHGAVSAWFNHTFAIYGIYYPNNVTEPKTCEKCHELDWATEQLDVVETTTSTMVSTANDVIKAAYTTIENAGLSEDKAAELTSTVDDAAATVSYWVADNSGGLHNPEGGYTAISAAAHSANDAALEALQLSNTALEDNITSLNADKTSLESQVGSLESQVTDLQTQVTDLQNQGIPGFPISSIVLGLLMSAAVVFYITKPKRL